MTMKINLIPLFVAIGIALTSYPLLTVSAPPMTDLPAAAGRIWLELNLSEGRAFEAGQFRFGLPPAGFLHDILVLLSCKLTGLSAVTALLVLDTLAWAGLLILLVKLGRRIDISRSLWLIPLLAGVFRWDFAGQEGLLAWRFGELMLVAFYLAAILAPSDRPPVKLFWLAPAVLYFSHGAAFAFWILLAAVYTWDTKPGSKKYIHPLAGCVPPGIYHLVRTWPLSAESAGPIEWGKWQMFSGSYSGPILQWSIVLTAGFVLAALIFHAIMYRTEPVGYAQQKRTDEHRHHLIQTAVLFAAALVLPYSANLQALELALLFSVPCACAPLPAASVVRRRILLPGVLLCALGGQCYDLQKYFAWSRDLQNIVFGDWRGALAPYRKLYSAVFPPLSAYPALAKYPHYAAEVHGVDPRQFAGKDRWVQSRSTGPSIAQPDVQIADYQRAEFTGFYDDILIVASPQDPFVPEYISFWKTAFPDGSITALSPFAHVFRKH